MEIPQYSTGLNVLSYFPPLLKYSTSRTVVVFSLDSDNRFQLWPSFMAKKHQNVLTNFSNHSCSTVFLSAVHPYTQYIPNISINTSTFNTHRPINKQTLKLLVLIILIQQAFLTCSGCAQVLPITSTMDPFYSSVPNSHVTVSQHAECSLQDPETN